MSLLKDYLATDSRMCTLEELWDCNCLHVSSPLGLQPN